MRVIIELRSKAIERIEHKVWAELLAEVSYGEQSDFPILLIHTPHIIEQVEAGRGRDEDHHQPKVSILPNRFFDMDRILKDGIRTIILADGQGEDIIPGREVLVAIIRIGSKASLLDGLLLVFPIEGRDYVSGEVVPGLVMDFDFKRVLIDL